MSSSRPMGLGEYVEKPTARCDKDPLHDENGVGRQSHSMKMKSLRLLWTITESQEGLPRGEQASVLGNQQKRGGDL